MIGRLRARYGDEHLLVLLAVLLAVAVRWAYQLATYGHALAGDEVEYDLEARLAADGKFLWSTTPYGEAQPSTWKSPVYPAFLGVAYRLLGDSYDRALLLQTLVFAPLLVLATWQLGKRLFGMRAGVIAAFAVGVYPNAWQFDARLYSEVISNPLTTITLAIALAVVAGRSRALDWRVVALLGGLLGLGILVRPSAIVLLAPLAVVCWAAAGLTGGLVRLGAIVGLAALVVAPWSIRNATLPGPWVPISVQSAAGYGVFNDDAANDPEDRWAWRPITERDRELFLPENARTDGELYQELNSRIADYIKENPSSVPQAFWANGIRRLWELRPPEKALNEVRFEGRTRAVSAIGLAMYYPIALLAVVGLVRAWRRGQRALVLAVVAVGLASSVAFTTDAGTRYRAPLEPLLVVLAVSALPASVLGRRDRSTSAA